MTEIDVEIYDKKRFSILLYIRLNGASAEHSKVFYMLYDYFAANF